MAGQNDKITFVKGEATRMGNEMDNYAIRKELQSVYDRMVENIAAVYRKKTLRDSERAMWVADIARRMGAVERAIKEFSK